MTGQGYHKAACPPYWRGEERLHNTPETLREDKERLTRTAKYATEPVFAMHYFFFLTVNSYGEEASQSESEL